MTREIEAILRQDCMDCICSMSLSLVDGRMDKFDFFYERYLSNVSMMVSRNYRIKKEMSGLVDALYQRRKENDPNTTKTD